MRLIPAFIDVPPGGSPEPAVREFLRRKFARSEDALTSRKETTT